MPILLFRIRRLLWQLKAKIDHYYRLLTDINLQKEHLMAHVDRLAGVLKAQSKQLADCRFAYKEAVAEQLDDRATVFQKQALSLQNQIEHSRVFQQYLRRAADALQMLYRTVRERTRLCENQLKNFEDGYASLLVAKKQKESIKTTAKDLFVKMKDEIAACCNTQAEIRQLTTLGNEFADSIEAGKLSFDNHLFEELRQMINRQITPLPEDCPFELIDD